MHALPPAPTHLTFTLTPLQQRRLELLPPECVVIGAEECCPLIRQESGRLMSLGSDGSLRRASARARRKVEQRLIDFFFPKERV
jgi:hypothetical protein